MINQIQPYYLSTDHPASSYGHPVLCKLGSDDVYGPDDTIKKNDSVREMEAAWLAPGATIPMPSAKKVVADLLSSDVWFDDPKMTELARKFISLNEAGK